MATKKIAGTERPYTWYEFLSIVRNIVEEKKVVMHDQLDYFNANYEYADKPIDLCVYDWRMVSQTDFGGNEGVYADFYAYVDYNDRRHVFTAKTLCEGEESYVKMHEFAARVCLIVRRYVEEHEDEFNWKGYDVGYWKDGKRVTYMMAHNRENALKYANGLKQIGENAWLRENETRKYEEV